MNTSDPRTAFELTVADVVDLAPSIIVESALFGVLTLLVTFSAVTIVRQGLTTRSRIFMGSALGVMYIASAVHWSVNIYTLLREIQNPVAWAAIPPATIYGWSLITATALFVGFWVSDIVVMWRAVVLWEWDRKVTVPCAILIVIPFVLALVDVVVDSTTTHATPPTKSFQPNIYGVIALLVSLLSNVLATSLIGIKAWNHHKSTQNFFGITGTVSTVQNTLILLIESGFLYCAVWALFIVTTVVHTGSFANTAHTISGIMPQIVGLYPSIIIVLVALRKTHCDRNFTHGPTAVSSAQFASMTNRSAAISISRLEEGNVGEITHRLAPSKPSHHRGFSGDVKDNDVYLSSLRNDKEDDGSSVTFTEDEHLKRRSLDSYDI